MDEIKGHSEVMLKKYDELINEQQEQIDTFIGEHTALKREVAELVAENDKLRTLVDGDFQKQLESGIVDKFSDVVVSEKVNNLKMQLEISWNERKQISEMYEISQQLIAKLERQIRNPSTNTVAQPDDPVVKILKTQIEEVTLQLKLEKNLREEQETQRIKYQTEEARIRMQLDEVTESFRRLQKDKIKGDETCQKLEQEKIILNATIDCITQCRDEFEAALKKSKEYTVILEMKNHEAVSKVKESVEVAEKSLSEKDLAQLREVGLQNEVIRLAQSLDEVSKSSATKISLEVNDIKTKCDERVSHLLKVKEDLENQLMTTTENFNQLLEESRRVERSMERQKRKAKGKELAESSAFLLESRLGATEQTLTDAQRTINEVVAQNEKLLSDLNEVRQREGQFQTLVTDFKNKLEKCRCKRLCEKVKKLKESRARQVKELKQHVQNQISLNEKWQREAEKMSELLTAQGRREEKLRSKNKILSAKLRQCLRLESSLKHKSGASNKEGYISC